MTPTSGSLLKRVARPPLRLMASIPGFKPLVRQISRRVQTGRTLFRAFPVDGLVIVTAPNGAQILYRSTPRDFIGRDLHWFGWNGFEPETTGAFLRLAEQARFFADIGSNTGFYTLLAGSVNDAIRVLAAEPVPRISDLLRTNIEINGLTARCEVYCGAIASESGTVAFHVPHDEVPTSASLETAGFRGYAGDVTEVPTSTLDELCLADGELDLVKIDVEGFEDAVLEGATGVLETLRPLIVVECNPDGPYRRVQQILERHGYAFYHLTAQGPVGVEKIVPDQSGNHRNYLCIPADAGARWDLGIIENRDNGAGM